MAVRTDGPAPYAPAATVLSVIDRYRNRGLQKPIDLDVLQRAGVTESLAPRTLQSLVLLDLISEEGEPLDNFEALARVPEADFPSKLADILREVYADVFQYVNPSEDGTANIRDAFRGYTPRGQQNRMVTLFTGLCAAAKIIDEEPPKTRARSASGSNRSSSRSTSSQGSSRGSRKGSGRTQNHLLVGDDVPPTVLGILAGLPKAGKTWTSKRRELFLSAFKSVVDLEYHVDDNLAGDDESEADE